jgi:hypothetical protein
MFSLSQVKHAISEIKKALIEGATMALEVSSVSLSPTFYLTDKLYLFRSHRQNNVNLSEAEVELQLVVTTWSKFSPSTLFYQMSPPECIELEISFFIHLPRHCQGA